MNLDEAVKNAQRRFVETESGNCGGSGVIITTGIVMTCFHSLRVDNEISINGKVGEVVAIDTKYDLALVQTETEEIPTVILGDTDIGRQVFCVGNPISLRGALLFGRVVWESDIRIVHDAHGAPGVSGSGLFNFKGELVGINHSVLGVKHIGSHYTIAVPAEKFHKILSHVFHIVSPTAEEVEKYGDANEEDSQG